MTPPQNSAIPPPKPSGQEGIIQTAQHSSGEDGNRRTGLGARDAGEKTGVKREGGGPSRERRGEARSGCSREMALGEVWSERGSSGAPRRRVWDAGEAGGAGEDGEGCQGWGLRYPRDSQGKALGRGGARGPAASPHSSAVTPGSERPLPRRRWRRRRTLRPRLLLSTGTGAGVKPGLTEAGLSPVAFRRLHTGSPL